jgi:hypothetical protein
MFVRVRQWLLPVVCGGVWAGSLGCAVFENRAATPLCEASLDGDRTICLTEYTQQNAALRGPKYNFDELTLTVGSAGVTGTGETACKCRFCRPAGDTVHVVARRDGQDMNSVERFKLGRLEARSNAAREKLWIVDLDASRVVATLDLDTTKTTGPDDEPPAWATPTGGVRLKPIATD